MGGCGLLIYRPAGLSTYETHDVGDEINQDYWVFSYFINQAWYEKVC